MSSESDTVYLALEPLLLPENQAPSPYELGKDIFGADQSHEDDIAHHTKMLLKERFKNNAG